MDVVRAALIERATVSAAVSFRTARRFDSAPCLRWLAL
jgi:hypothetical protein